MKIEVETNHQIYQEILEIHHQIFNETKNINQSIK